MLLTLLLIVTLLVLINWNRCNSVEQLNEDDSNYNLYTGVNSYRIGDLIRGMTHVKNYQSNLDLAADTLVQFPNSIASDYIRNIDTDSLHKKCNLDENKELYLHKVAIIKKLMNNYNIPHNESAVVHLRVGDILDLPDENPPTKQQLNEYVNSGVKKGSKYEKYVKTLSYYNNLIRDLKQNNINKVTIIAGSHIECPNYYVSSYYINMIKNFFEKNGIHVTLRLGLHPDEDLKLACGSKKVYGSGGGYSELLELLNNST